MDAEIANMIREQSERHHRALSSVEARYQQTTREFETLNEKIDRVVGWLGGTPEQQGLIHRQTALERAFASLSERNPSRWLSERGTKMLDVVLGAMVVAVLGLALRAYILEAVRTGDAHEWVRPRYAEQQKQQHNRQHGEGG